MFRSFGWLFIFFFRGIIINPERRIIKEPQNNPYYESEIAERSRLFFIFAIILIPSSIILSIFLFYKYDPNCEKTKLEDEIKKTFK